MLINPKRAQKRSWEMFLIGLVYGSLSIILVNWIFGEDAVLAKYSGILIITFCVMFSMPYMYYAIKLEEEKDMKIEGAFRLLKEHNKTLFGFLWLFLGFIIAFSFFYIAFPSENNFRAQIETYCMINRPANFNECTEQYGIKVSGKTTGFLTSKEKLIAIFTNNIYVLMFTLIFSLIFGAGAIFVLAWNASVIAAAVGIFSKSNLASLPLGVARYMIHGLPEIAAYFIGAMAGGIISISVIRHNIRSEKFWSVLQDSLNLIILAVIVLFVAALVEVFITPALF
ncbi:hypothetical protein A3K73_01865 [Candidatus Pacearchaeota archaeon RBG_13_36_9]|nr:MAG: hypothetical protein A3K73_01865 [Candidatus Pacearchaeota archaeon RBG_13_36_9]